MKDLFLCLRIDPDSLPHLSLYPCHLFHQTVNILSLPSGIGTDIDHINVLTFQKAADDLELFLHRGNHLIEKFFRNKRQRSETPAFVFFIVNLRITHSDQMTNAPGHHRIFALQITVLPDTVYTKRLGKFLGHAWFLCNI